MTPDEYADLKRQLEILNDLTDRETEGAREYRIEAVCDAAVNAVIMDATTRAGNRSRAIRDLILDGARFRAQRIARKVARA